MRTIRTTSTRNKVYLLITWLLVGIVVVYGACFTVLNGSSHLSFSIDNNDLYQVEGKWLANYGYYEGIYYLPVQVNLKHDNVHYMRLVVKGIEEEGVTLDLDVHTNDGKDIKIVTNAPLTSGDNYIEIPRKDFSAAIIYIYGTDLVIIEEIQFRERNVDIRLTDVLPIILAAVAIYTTTSAIGIIIIRRTLKRRRS